MSKYFKISIISLLSLLIIIFLLGKSYSSTKETDSHVKNWKEQGFDKQQLKALTNAKEYIDSSNFHQKNNIDFNIVEFNTIDEQQFSLVQWLENEEKTEYNSRDIVITIGSLTEHSFAQIVVDHNTQDVIGYLPTK